jgi:hypothetical protein
MDNIRRINRRWIWIFPGLFALMLALMGLLLFLPASPIHAASVQGCKEKGLQTSVKVTKGQQLVSCPGEPAKGAKGKQTISCTVGPVKGAKGQGIVKVANWQKTTFNCTGGQLAVSCSGVPATPGKVGKEQGITEVAGKQLQTNAKGAKLQGTPITCTARKK